MSNEMAGTVRGDAVRTVSRSRRSGFLLALVASTALVAVPALAAPVETIEDLAGGGGGRGGYTGSSAGPRPSGGAAAVSGPGMDGSDA